MLDTAKDLTGGRLPLRVALRLTLLACIAFPAEAIAGISVQNSWVALSPDGSTLLVMISPDIGHRGGTTDFAVLPDGSFVDLLATFGKSGAYDPLTLAPLWQVDWYARQSVLFCSSDGSHVAIFNDYGFTTGWALEFFDHGRLIRQYPRSQLLTGLSYFMAGSDEPWYGCAQLTADGTGVRLATPRRRVRLGDHYPDLGLQEFYTFNLSTGEMISREVVGRWKVWAYAALPLPPLIALTILSLWWRRWMKTRPKCGFTPILGTEG